MSTDSKTLVDVVPTPSAVEIAALHGLGLSPANIAANATVHLDAALRAHIASAAQSVAQLRACHGSGEHSTDKPSPAARVAPASDERSDCPLRSHISSCTTAQTKSSRKMIVNDRAAHVVHEWFVIDATDKVLGRVASEVALRLCGKHKPIYTQVVDTDDFVVVINADKVRVTGARPEDKVYHCHSGYPDSIYATKFKDLQVKQPGRALEKAVKGMLPRGPLGYAMLKKLKVCGGNEFSSRTRRAREES